MNRRHFLSTAFAASVASSLSAIEPIHRGGLSRMQLGLAAYSFRDYFQWSRGKEQPPKDGRKAWDLFGFIDYCADHNVAGAELTSYYFPPDADEKYFLDIKRHAYIRGVQITGTAVNNNFALPKGEKLDAEIAMVKQWIDYADIMNAPHIRVFAGPVPKEISIEEAVKNCTEAYQECLDYAGKKGIFLGLENHGGIVATPDNLIKMVQTVNSPWAGINFDSGNFHTDDPYADLEKIAPYSINVQLKMEMKTEDKQISEADVPQIIGLLKAANYQGWFTLEYEVKADPFEHVPAILDQIRPLLPDGRDA